MKQRANPRNPAEKEKPAGPHPDEWLAGFNDDFESANRHSREVSEGLTEEYGLVPRPPPIVAAETLYPIFFDLAESGGELILRAELPGVSDEQHQLEVEPHRVRITTRKQRGDSSESEKVISVEDRSVEIPQVLNLPMEVDPSVTTATINCGMLELRMPRAINREGPTPQPEAPQSGEESRRGPRRTEMIEAKVTLTQPNSALRQFVAQTGSEHHMILDDLVGGTGPKPIELVAVALAGCTAFDVITYLRFKRHQNVSGYEVRVEADQAEKPPQVFTAIRIHHLVTGVDVDAKAVEDAIKLSEDKYCSVGAMLRHSAEIVTTFEVVSERIPAPAAA